MDAQRLRKTLAFLLRHRPDVGGLRPDPAGWCDLARVARAATRLTREPIAVPDIVRLAREDPRAGLEVGPGRVRMRAVGRGGRVPLPDILYLPVVREDMEMLAAREVLQRPDGSPIRLVDREYRAWLAAHRQPEGEPAVLYVDASRASRAGTRFRSLGGGHWSAESLPVRHILNLRPDFGIQASAGGFLVRWRPDGRPEVALVRVRRRSGVTWEVAKGKMEVGETPVATALREIREEMGVDVPLEVVADLGPSPYGFSTPSGEPRLKILHLFILRAQGPLEAFHPQTEEGIEEVAFFDPDEAVRAITHGSLREPVRRLRRWLAEREGPAPDLAQVRGDEAPVWEDDATPGPEASDGDE